MMPIPNGPTLFVSEYERVVSFHYFPRENEIGSVLLHLRADEGKFIPFAKPYTHVVEERFRAEILNSRTFTRRSWLRANVAVAAPETGF